MELTQEYFDKQLKNLATKQDIAEVKQSVTEAVEELARIIGETVAIPMQEHFNQLHEELPMRDRIEHLESDMQKIAKNAPITATMNPGRRLTGRSHLDLSKPHLRLWLLRPKENFRAGPAGDKTRTPAVSRLDDRLAHPTPRWL